MDQLRTAIFIDGRNFKHNLQAFQFIAPNGAQQGRPYQLDEKHFQWRQFFLGLLRKFDEETLHQHRLLRVYWYNAESIRPFQLNQRLIDQGLEVCRREDQTISRDNLIRLATDWYDKERHHFDQTRETVFERIQRKVDFLEFKYVGEYVVKPFEPYMFRRREDGSHLYLGTREGEKGVDVGIAVDMISKMGNYDVAVLVSGDADFIPVVRYLKDNLRFVYQFSLARGIPPRINYLSPWLIGRVDCFQAFNELELLRDYLDERSGIPPAILSGISTRIKQLEEIAASGA